MDGRGRLAQPLNRTGILGENVATDRRRAAHARASPGRFAGRDRFAIWFGRRARVLDRFRLTRGGGVAASVLIILASIGYGAIRGNHVDIVATWLGELRDGAANAAGFRVTGVALSGHRHLNREEILARAGITGDTSLLFFDVARARAKLVADPWIADATIQKLYPNRLQITVTEREPFALWQKSGRVRLIAADGTVLESYVSPPFAGLPLVVGSGAHRRAKDFIALLNRFPDIRDHVRAAILIAERRWNLRLKNGIDVRLPDTEVERALERLVELDRAKRLLSRDIVAIDLRLGDRVTVRLSEAAARARAGAPREQARQRKAGQA